MNRFTYILRLKDKKSLFNELDIIFSNYNNFRKVEKIQLLENLLKVLMKDKLNLMKFGNSLFHSFSLLNLLQNSNNYYRNQNTISEHPFNSIPNFKSFVKHNTLKPKLVLYFTLLKASSLGGNLIMNSEILNAIQLQYNLHHLPFKIYPYLYLSIVNNQDMHNEKKYNRLISLHDQFLNINQFLYLNNFKFLTITSIINANEVLMRADDILIILKSFNQVNVEPSITLKILRQLRYKFKKNNNWSSIERTRNFRCFVKDLKRKIH